MRSIVACLHELTESLYDAGGMGELHVDDNKQSFAFALNRLSVGLDELLASVDGLPIDLVAKLTVLTGRGGKGLDQLANDILLSDDCK